MLVSSSANAHFKLTVPSGATVQDLIGGPQKSAPCGQSDTPNVVDESTPTNIVSTLTQGSMIDITITETIFHPGHYRVSIAQDLASLPQDPAVTPDANSACGSTVIDATPSLPLLADGLLLHTSSLSGAQTMKVQLPAGMTCTNCVLQVVQFMSNHPLNNPGGCYYHHCATVTINAEGTDAGATAGGDAGLAVDEPSGGCCSTGGSSGVERVGSLLVGLVLVRRRRSSWRV